MTTCISVSNLGKRFRIHHETRPRYLTFRESLGNAARNLGARVLGRAPTASANEEEFWALRDVNFEIRAGERIGIIGGNGAGKSTLLKILGRVTDPTTGKVVIRGRVASLLEVGTGFHPELTGRENIFLNGAVLGMKRAEIERRFDEIVAFAETERFLDTPVKWYSSGMYVRLAFAVAAHVDSDILIVDEVLAVGDAEFQAKCLRSMKGAVDAGSTVVFVSHSIPTIRALCTRAIWLSEGVIHQDGPVDVVTEAYMNVQNVKHKRSATYQDDPEKAMQILKAELLPDVASSDDVLFRCDYIARERVPNALLCVEVRNAIDVSVFYANDDSADYARKRDIGVHAAILRIPANLLSPGDYSVAYGFWEPGRAPLDFPSDRLTFRKRETVVTRLSAHSIGWPSVIYIPKPEWHFHSNPE